MKSRVFGRSVLCLGERTHELFIEVANLVYSSDPIVKSISFKISPFPSFTRADLDRLKDDGKWLSDTPVTFCLLCVPFFIDIEFI